MPSNPNCSSQPRLARYYLMYYNPIQVLSYKKTLINFPSFPKRTSWMSLAQLVRVGILTYLYTCIRIPLCLMCVPFVIIFLIEKKNCSTLPCFVLYVSLYSYTSANVHMSSNNFLREHLSYSINFAPHLALLFRIAGSAYTY